jgi:hypothetical protein
MKIKNVFILFLLCGAVGISGFAHAEQYYGPDFVGPQQDPFAQYGSVSSGDRCGPQGNGDYILCESTGGIINQTQTNFAAFLREMYTLAFILAGTVAFVRIVYGGILYSWSGVIDRKKEAIGIFKNVAIGMALLMGSYAVLNTINPALTILALPDVTMGTPRSPRDNRVPTLPLSSLNGMPSSIEVLDKSIDAIRQENLNIINNLGLYLSAVPDDEATIGLINGQIEAIGTPTNAAERTRLTELQNALTEYQTNKAEIEAATKAVGNTPPQQYKRTKTAP